MKWIYVSLILLMLVSLVSADNLGTYEINKPMKITNYCNSGSCSYVTLNSLEYSNGSINNINTNMTKNSQTFSYNFTPTTTGTYYFTTCGDPEIDICERDDFFVNFNGEETPIGITIILLLFFISLALGYSALNKKINYEKWYEGILKKSENKNYIKVAFSTVAYNFIRDKFTIYYLLIFPIVIILTDIIMTYNINSLYVLFENAIFVYSFGVALVAFSLFGKFQEFIMNAVEDLNKKSWGMNDK